jgi:phenylacetic acid degradation operon negative regulatory protein
VNDQLRRRSVGVPAARSVLLTILGEYGVHRQDGMWTETLVRALEELGYRPQAARQALARSVKAGWLQTARHGRRSRLTLVPETAALLRTGAARIYSFGEDWTWDGRWLLIVLRVPEQRREVRHQVRTRLAWAGFGSLGGGLWISPHFDRESELLATLGDDSVAEVLSFEARPGSVGKPDRIITEAWDLDAVAAAYRDFIGRYSRMRASRPDAAFRAQTRLVHDWRKFPFLDPDLPEDLLPRRWPRVRAHALFHERHAQWADAAQEHFQALEDGAG